MNAIATAVMKLEQWFSEHMFRSLSIKTVIPPAAHAPENVTPHVIWHQTTVVTKTAIKK
jgi:hypothetical protein